ncbi:hypothetical protein L198_00847 [Cryptococcus wingfieldii CBS 7118]|uniref:Uncharacterized protein n=1 Tax=Cryptococcus wingfieldii CBS 7118 TaxID=1295528 RepID=A0A1E3K271_9TREE|nr:hypothetical protein L198_00847 [Cryptococcus wingfieldii CBS 7118]ODO07268.1 hypothetical protein L198_00847 [Cryptococcus wingfieldii CBS 7118]
MFPSKAPLETPLALSSPFKCPPPKLAVVRDPSIRVRQAVRDNNVSLLARLQYKTDLRNTDKNRLTSLSWAAIEGSLEVFEWLLLDYGHDDQELSRDADNNTILHLLASVPSLSLSPHTHLLLASSLPPRTSPLSLAEQSTISLQMTQSYLTLFPFLLNWSNTGGKTALHVAAQSGNSPFIEFLCDFAGADVDMVDLQGNAPLHYAAAWGHLESVRVLLEKGCQFGAQNFEGFTANDFAYSERVKKGLQDMAREIFDERRMRRKEERERMEREREREGARARSGSQSTSASLGGSSVGVGSYPSNPGRYFEGYTPAPAASVPMSRRGSDQASVTSSIAYTRPSQTSSRYPSIPRLNTSPSAIAPSLPTTSSPLATQPPVPSLAAPPASVTHQASSTPFPARYPTMPGPASVGMVRPSASIGPGLATVPGGSQGAGSIKRANSAQGIGREV